MEEFPSMTATVIHVVGNYPIGHEFFGNELHNDVSFLYPKAQTMYTDTLMRAMRRYCSHQYITVDHNRSLYKRVDISDKIAGGKHGKQRVERKGRKRNKRPKKTVGKTRGKPKQQYLLF